MPSEEEKKEDRDDDEFKERELAEDILQGDRLIFNTVDIKGEKSISKLEFCIFFAFAILFCLIIFLQLGISQSFLINDSIRKSINDWEDNKAFDDIQTLDDFVDFYTDYLKQLYKTQHYYNYNKSEDEMYSVKNFNYLVSSLRLTQRRMKLKKNNSPISKNFIKEMWAGDEILYDDPKQSFENTSNIDSDENLAMFEYDSGGYGGNGGFVLNIDISTTSQSDAIKVVNETVRNKWLDDQTANLILDFVVYNPYLDIILYTRLIVQAEPSGRLETKVLTDSLKRAYYESGLDVFRAVVECFFLIVCLFYIVRKGYEIYNEILSIKAQFTKDMRRRIVQKKFKKQRIEENKNGGEEEKKDDEEEGPENESDDEEEEEQVRQKCSCACICKNTWLCFTTTLKGVKRFLSDPWNCIDIANIIILIISLFVWMIFIGQFNARIDNVGSASFFQDTKHNDDIEYVSWLLSFYQKTVSLNLILISFKVLRYVGAVISNVTVMFKVLRHAQSDIIYFFALYLIIFVSFTTTFHIFYGSQVDRFATYGDSFNTLFLYLGRNILKIDEMKEMSFNFTVIYFIIFITSMEFILMNMFIAIIALSYSTVNKKMKDDKKNTDEALKRKHPIVYITEWISNLKDYSIFKRSKGQAGQNSDQKDNESENREESNKNEQSQFESQSPSPEKSKGEHVELPQEPPHESDEVGLDKEDEEEEEADVEKSEVSDKTKKKADTNFESTNKNDTHNASPSEENEVDINDQGDNPEAEQQKKYDNPEEEIQNKLKLQTMEWDKKFNPNYFIDENTGGGVLESEKEEHKKRIGREKKKGREVWSLILYIAFFSIFSYLIFAHVRVSMFNMYNDSLKNNFEGVTIDSSGEYINITETSTYEQVTDWLNKGLIQVLDGYCFDDCEKLYFFINDYNFVLESSMRLCFNMAKKSSSTHSGGPKPKTWNRDSLSTEDYVGPYSHTTYHYTSNGYHGEESYCRIIDTGALYYDYWYNDNNNNDIFNFTQDEIISDRLYFVSLEFVTYEPSNYFYSYSSIYIELLDNGDMTTSLDIASLDIRKYNEWYHWIRMIFELIFMGAVFYMIFNFVKNIMQKLHVYGKWENMEVKVLSKIEKERRHKAAPEYVRKFWAVVDFFIIFELLFYVFSIVIMIMWLVFIVKYQKLNDDYSENVNGMYNDFYDAKQLFDQYKIILSLASICISFNLLSHIFMLNHCLADSKMEIIYFLIFYIILILGFVAMSHLTFGPYIEEYHTFGDAMVECFSIILGDFDFLALEEIDSFMAVAFFYPYNLLFVFILANMLLAIMNTAYIESNAKKKKSNQSKERWLRVLFYCFFNKDEKPGDDPKKGGKNNEEQPHDEAKEKDEAPAYVANLENLAFRKEEDYKLWAINCAEEIRQENIERAKLKKECYDELKRGNDPAKAIAARIKYWDYLRRAIQIIDLQNGVIENQNRKLAEKLEAKNKEYELEREKTDKMYIYIDKLEKPVAENLKLVMHCMNLQRKLDEYEKKQKEYIETQRKLDAS